MIHELGWLLFFVALITSVIIHEAGHFLTAKRFGMKATQFFAGFGPTLWSVQRGETEYGVKAIPAGGFVKIIGMTSLEEVSEADEPRAFYKQKAWKRTIVLAAGSFMHFVIALVLLWAGLLLVGSTSTSLTLTQVTCAKGTISDTCSPTTPAPAAAAGIKPGDKLISYDGKALKDWDAFTKAVQAAGTKPATVVYQRDGVLHTASLTPVTVKDENGQTLLIDPKKDPRPAPKIGVSSVKTTHYNALSAVPEAFATFGTGVSETVTGVSKLPSEIAHAFDKGRTADNSPASVVGVGKIAGDAVASGSFASRLAGFLGIIAALNLFVGLFNLLPLLPLDGGHIAILWFEEARLRLARLFRRPDPGRVDINKLAPALYVVLVLIVGLSVTLLAADIVNPIANPF
jgi:membrane-associated protease RseP (regulator of RpoE activity)